jgi:multidrug efflux pump subunit AcrA (membrane-fusion protein)
MDIKSKRGAVKVALSVLVLAAGGSWLIGGHAEQTTASVAVSRPALTVRTTVLREDKWARTLTANGSILPWQEAIITAQMQGVRIADVKVSIGDQVRQGDVLVTLDNAMRMGD